MTKELSNSDGEHIDTSEPCYPPSRQDEFPPTLFFEVAAARGDGANSREAIASLCEKYWYPLYAFLRKRGRSVEDAQDLTQGFFLKFLGGNGFSGFDPSKGRLRSYMLGALKNYEAECMRSQQTQKRGGQFKFVSFEWVEAEASYAAEPNDISSPDLLYDRRWATMLLANVDAELKQRYQSRGDAELFDVIYDFLNGIPEESSHPKAAQTLGMTVAAVKMAIKRLRDRRTRILRSHVSATVASEDLIDEEISHIFGLRY